MRAVASMTSDNSTVSGGHVQQAGGAWCQVTAEAGTRESSPQTEVRGLVVRDRRAEGCDHKRALTSGNRLKVIPQLITGYRLPVQLACSAVGGFWK